MAKYRKVTDPTKIVTDFTVLKHLERGRIDKDYVALFEGYTKAHPTVKLYRDGVSKQMIACCSGLPKVTAQGKPIVPLWYHASGAIYRADENLFTAKIESSKSHVAVGAQEALWNPAVYLNGKKQSCGKSTLLETDPVNGNYHYNVLEWDYGLCKRRLRLIEGTIIELWIFDENPGGDVVIKSNVKGNLGAKGYYAIDAEHRPLLEFDVIGDEKRLPAGAWQNVVYPVTVDDSYTGYSSTSDGDVFNQNLGLEEEEYLTSHDAAEALVLDNASDSFGIGQNVDTYGNGEEYNVYSISRGCVYFSVPGGISISAGTLSLYGSVNHSATNFDIVVQIGSGTPPTYPHDPLVKADFDKDFYSGDGGSFSTAGFSTAGYNNITLNATGYGWIRPGGATKFCLRSSRDISSIPPVDEDTDEFVYTYTTEKGTGYKPKLVITYTPVPAPRHAFVNFQEPGIL